MKVELLVSEWCTSCRQAEKIWQGVAEARDFQFQVVDMAQPEGRELANRLRIRSIPALVIDGELKGVGVQGREEALNLVAQAPPRRQAAAQHIGMDMAASSRAAIMAAAAYLFVAGGALVFNAGLLGPAGYARPAPLHVFSLGFLVFIIYGLGEHMLPRFTGNPIRLGAWSWLQQGLAHWGVLGLAGGLWLTWPGLAIAGAVSAWLALALFAGRLWPVLWPRRVGRLAPEED